MTSNKRITGSGLTNGAAAHGVKVAPRCGSCECTACKVVPHTSDCAAHNEPAIPAGLCDCGAWLKRARELVRALLDADRASERSVAKGGAELDEPFAVAFDALDDHLKAHSVGAMPSQPDGDLAAIRQRLQNSVNWMMEGRNTGLCPGVADFQALIRLIDACGVSPTSYNSLHQHTLPSSQEGGEDMGK